MALYESSTWAWDGIVRSVYGNTFWYAQTFTPQVTHAITSVILALGRPSGDSPGIVTVSIRATEAGGPNIGKPTGDDLCSGTTDGDTVNELTGLEDDPTEREITFGTNPTLVAGTKYAIVVRALDGGTSDKLYWLAATSSVYADGDQCHSSGGIAWTLYDDRELWFKEYGNLILPGDPHTPIPTHEATEVTSFTLSWEDGGRTDTFDVYFRAFGEFFEKIASDIVDLSVSIEEFLYGNRYNYGELYLWCVIAKNEHGVNYAPPSDFGIGYGGTIWEFNAAVFDPPLPTGVTLDYSGDSDDEGWGEPTGTPTGENAMLAIRRLVAAANSKIWYEDI